MLLASAYFLYILRTEFSCMDDDLDAAWAEMEADCCTGPHGDAANVGANLGCEDCFFEYL